MRQYVLKSLAVVLVAAGCSEGGGPTTTTAPPPPPPLEWVGAPTATAGYDTALVSWTVRPRPVKGEVACPGREVVSSGALSMNHSVVLRGLPLGTEHNCKVRVWEDGASPIETAVSFRTRAEPCADPNPPMATFEFYYKFPPGVAADEGVVVLRTYDCGGAPSNEESAYAADRMPEGVVRVHFPRRITRPFGRADHVICALRGDLIPLQGTDFTLQVVGGSGLAVSLARSVRKKPFESQPEMNCWEFGLSRDSIHP